MYAEASEGKMGLPPDRCSRKPWVSYIPDSVLTAVVIGLAGGGSYLIRRAEYLGGLHGMGVGQSFPLTLGLKPLIVFITLALVAPVAVIRLRRGPHTCGHVLLRLAFPVVCLMALLIPIRTPGPLAAIYLQGVEQRMLETVDIDAVQQWLMKNGARYAGREYQGSFPPELPTCLTELHPSLILFSGATPEHDVTIEFRWYAPHGENYGLVIGPPSAQIIQEGLISLPGSSFNEFRRPIKPGVYVFTRG
jgi:hypothetical protein